MESKWSNISVFTTTMSYLIMAIESSDLKKDSFYSNFINVLENYQFDSRQPTIKDSSSQDIPDMILRQIHSFYKTVIEDGVTEKRIEDIFNCLVMKATEHEKRQQILEVFIIMLEFNKET